VVLKAHKVKSVRKVRKEFKVKSVLREPIQQSLVRKVHKAKPVRKALAYVMLVE
jgi:hypothetical protein